jgi:hypothetical protein
MRPSTNRPSLILAGLLAAMLTMVTALPQSFADQPTWLLTKLQSRGVDRDSVDTFADLLAGQLSSDWGWSVERSAQSCSGADEAARAGRGADTEYVICGAVSKLGAATVVSLTAVEVATETTVGSHTLKVDRLEDLDTVAVRMARALRKGQDTDDTAELGAITHEEAKPKVRRGGETGPLIRLGAVVPGLSPAYADGLAGASADLGIWHETLDFSIEPRLGVRFDTSGDEASWLHIPIDIAGHYIFSRGDIAPMVGLGAGLHYLHEKRPVTLETGQTFQTRTETVLEDNVWAFGMFARAGILFLRTYSVRLAVTVDYSMLIADINQHSNPRAWNFGIATIF